MSATPARPFTLQPRVLIVDLGETRYADPAELEPADVQVAALDSTGRPWVFRFYSDCGLDFAVGPDGHTHPAYDPAGVAPIGIPANLWAAVMAALDVDAQP